MGFHPGYAIIRIAENIDSPEPGSIREFGQMCPWHPKVTVKKVVMSMDEAEREVDRLNTLAENKGCIYFWQYTRVEEAKSQGEAPKTG